MKNNKQRKHAIGYWIVIVCGVIFLAIIEKPIESMYAPQYSYYDAQDALVAGLLTAITMIVIALIIFFIARQIDYYYGYPKDQNGDAENGNNEMQEMQESDTDKQ